MILSDVLYGDFEVNEPIIEELINAPVFQRLKGIRSGSYYPAAPYVAGIVTRYELQSAFFCCCANSALLWKNKFAACCMMFRTALFRIRWII